MVGQKGARKNWAAAKTQTRMVEFRLITMLLIAYVAKVVPSIMSATRTTCILVESLYHLIAKLLHRQIYVFHMVAAVVADICWMIPLKSGLKLQLVDDGGMPVLDRGRRLCILSVIVEHADSESTGR